MGSEPPWTQTFSDSWLEDQGLKTNTHIEILFIFASFSSQSQRFPGGNFAVGNVEVQWQCQAGSFAPSQQEQFHHRVLVPLCAFPIPSSTCQRLWTIWIHLAQSHSSETVKYTTFIGEHLSVSFFHSRANDSKLHLELIDGCWGRRGDPAVSTAPNLKMYLLRRISLQCRALSPSIFMQQAKFMSNLSGRICHCGVSKRLPASRYLFLTYERGWRWIVLQFESKSTSKLQDSLLN